MKDLFYIRAYNHRTNQRARFLVTGTQSIAEDKVTRSLSADWRIEYVDLVCSTDVDVFREIT